MEGARWNGAYVKLNEALAKEVLIDLLTGLLTTLLNEPLVEETQLSLVDRIILIWKTLSNEVILI